MTFEDIKRGDLVTVIYKTNTGREMRQGYIRYIDQRYLIIGMGFRDDWLNLEREKIIEVRKNVSGNNNSRIYEF